MMCRAARYSPAASTARLRPSPSDLLTAIMSASSSTPFLMPCNSSPAPGSISTRKKSVMSATAVSDWPMPTVSTRITSNPAASHSSMVSRVLAATPPSVPDDGRWADEGVAFDRQPGHAGLVAEDRAAGARRRWVHRQHRDFVAGGDEIGAQRVDGGGFADARHAGDADPHRRPGEGQERLHQLPRPRLMLGLAALDQGDGARRASRGRPRAGDSARVGTSMVRGGWDARSCRFISAPRAR